MREEEGKCIGLALSLGKIVLGFGASVTRGRCSRQRGPPPPGARPPGARREASNNPAGPVSINHEAYCSFQFARSTDGPEEKKKFPRAMSVYGPVEK